MINVEAVVTSRGDRLYGLQKQDFRLLVDKVEVPIEYFSEVGAPGSSPPGISYLVFLDDFFSIPARRDPALERLRVGLALLRPEDRMAIVAYDGRRLDMLCPPTSDRRRAAAGAGGSQAAAGLRPAAALGSEPLVCHDAPAAPRLRQQLHRHRLRRRRPLEPYDLEPVQEMFGKVERLSVAAASALRGFQGGEGRKVLLMYSGGVPLSLPDMSLFVPLHHEVAPFTRARYLYSTLLEAANRLGYTVYPVDLWAPTG